MSDELVKRLREDQPVTQDMSSTMQCALQDAAADRIDELEGKLEKAIEALAWYGLHAAGCRIIHREGDGHRIALSEDGGAKARATLAEIQP